jgi:hypothetical protein
MAVRAPHVALCDLIQQVFPGPSIQHRANIVDLLGAVTMVELEHDGVSLATVNARVRR